MTISTPACADPGHRRPSAATFAVIATLLATFFLTAPALAAVLTNPDFSAGFEGWQGQVTSCTICDGSDDSVVDLTDAADFATYPGNYATGADGATLLSTFDIDGIFGLALFQSFAVDTPGGPVDGLVAGLRSGLQRR